MGRKTILLLLIAILAGCHKPASHGGQAATLTMRDGTTVNGTVTASDTSSITIQTPNGVVSTYPLSQVASVSYNAAPGTAQNAAPATPPPAEPPPAAPAPPPAEPLAQPTPAAANSNPQPEQQYVPAETFRTIPAGRTLAIRTDEAIDSRTATAGQTHPGTVARDVTDTTGQVAIPRGSPATLVVREARTNGKLEGHSELALDVVAVRVEGRQYRLETNDFVERGKDGLGANKRTAKFAGGASVFGTIIGAVAGGGKGAAIGALSGAAAGAGAQDLTRGKNLRIPAEAVLNFRLEAPIRIRELR